MCTTLNISLKSEPNLVTHTRGMGGKPWLRDRYRFGCRNWIPVFIDTGSQYNNFAMG
jgi:hypothetical protein